jgi:hypothetical protein
MGERAKNIGEEAEERVRQFITDLGYEIDDTNLEKYDIDGVVNSPEDKPEIGLGRPLYSPNGLVAFETREPNPTTTKVDKFRKKILKYNKENNEKLKGGIYIADCKMSAGILEFMKKRQIWGWGQNRTRLYREKVNAFYYWSKKNASVKEKQLGKTTSYLQIATPPPTDSEELLHFIVICDDLETKLSPKIVRNLMKTIRTRSMTPLIEHGIVPMNVYFEFFSIGGLGKRDLLISEADKVVKSWKEEGISAKVGKFTDFRTFVTL